METEDPIDPDLYQRAEALLEPGEIELVGIIVHTELGSDDEATLHETTIEIGEHIAEYAGVDPKDTYVYSGNDDADFGVNQHQGRTLDGDEFIWECQQLLREEEFKIVFYYEADTDQESLVEAVREDGYTVESVSEPN